MADEWDEWQGECPIDPATAEAALAAFHRGDFEPLDRLIGDGLGQSDPIWQALSMNCRSGWDGADMEHVNKHKMCALMHRRTRLLRTPRRHNATGKISCPRNSDCWRSNEDE